MRPNIVLIVFDTARADAFEPYGAPAGASPVVARLAAEGEAAPATRATACWTVPSHISMLSGLLPRASGFRPANSMRGYGGQLEPITARMLPAVLSTAGYRTVGFSTNMWVSPATGFAAPFDDFEFIRGWRARKLSAGGARTRAAWYLEALRARLDDGAVQVAQRFDDLLDTPGRDPFFCFVNLVECHSPYLPPRPWNDLGAADRLRAGRDARRYLNLSSIWKCSTGGFDVPDRAVELMRRLYAASVRQLDDWLGGVLDSLSRRGLLDDTQVIVTSDHGENLGDGRMLSHAFSLDDRLLRVPLVTRGPATLPAGGMGSLRELPAWVAQIAAVDSHPYGEPPAQAVPAVAQFDTPLTADDPRVDEAIAQWGIAPELAPEVRRRLTTSFACAAAGERKLVRRLGREELFDLTADPLEESPRIVAPDAADDEALRPLRAVLDAAEAQPVERPSANGAGPDRAEGEAGAEETAHLEDQMRLLGYL